MTNKTISSNLLKWYDRFGRKDLPWRQDITPYRVWLSETMLQQTQVTTVIPYYQRFLSHFPNIQQLAGGDEEQVLHLWAGLGYYSRARNLLRTAKIIARDYNNIFPKELEKLMSLPGIGRSTAGAIRAIAFNEHATILDGNVKRIIARVHAIHGWPGKSHVAKKLWYYAEYHTPKQRVGDYTQAIMDLGASVCHRKQPQCQCCPITKHCQAYQQGNPENFPGKKAKKIKPTKTCYMLIMYRVQNNTLLLSKNPPSGVWAGLWSLPQCATDLDITTWCLERYGTKIKNVRTLTEFRHTFSHFHLDIKPILVEVVLNKNQIMDPKNNFWYNLMEPLNKGVPAPVQRLLNETRSLINDSQNTLFET